MGQEATGEPGADYSIIGEGGSAATPRRPRFTSPFGRRTTPVTGDGDADEAEEIQDGSGQTLRVGGQTVAGGQKRPKFRASDTVSKITITAARATAKSTIFPINQAVKIAFGEDAELQKEESDLIIEPLANIYMRNASVADKVSRFSDPVTLVLALCVWGMRIYYILLARQAQAQAMAAQYYPQPDPQAQHTPAPAEPTPPRVRQWVPVTPEGGRPDYVPPSVLHTQFNGKSDLERMAEGS